VALTQKNRLAAGRVFQHTSALKGEGLTLLKWGAEGRAGAGIKAPELFSDRLIYTLCIYTKAIRDHASHRQTLYIRG
jgi:hypothetical protein